MQPGPARKRQVCHFRSGRRAGRVDRHRKHGVLGGRRLFHGPPAGQLHRHHPHLPAQPLVPPGGGARHRQREGEGGRERPLVGAGVVRREGRGGAVPGRPAEHQEFRAPGSLRVQVEPHGRLVQLHQRLPAVELPASAEENQPAEVGRWEHLFC